MTRIVRCVIANSAPNRRWRLQFRYRGSRRESAVAQLFSLGRLTHMKISRQIWSFIGFALVALSGFGGFWLWEKLHASIFTICLIIPIGVLILVGILGMVWSLVEWLVFGMTALHRAAGFRREDLRHKKSSA